MKRLILKFLIIAGFFSTVGFFYSYHLPEFKVWAIEHIADYTTKNTPVKVFVSNIEFNLYPVGVSLKAIRLIPQKELSEIASESFIKEVRLSLSPMSFLTGLFQFSKVEIVEPKISIKNVLALKKFQKANSTDTKINLKEILQVPLSSFIIHRMNLNIAPQENIPRITLNNFSLEIENQKTSALISLLSPHLILFDPKIAEVPADISIGSRILVQEDQILVSALKIKKGESFILAGGYTQAPLSKIKFDEVNLKIKTHLQLAQLRKEVLPFLKNVKLPDMEGVVESQTQIVKNPQETISVESKVLVKDLKIDRYFVGHVIGQGFYKNDSLTSPMIQVQNSMGKLHIKDLQANFVNNREFKFTLGSDKTQLQEILRNLGMGELPVKLEVTTNLPCAGQLLPAPVLKCAGDMAMDHLRVYNSHLDIVRVESGKIHGATEINKTGASVAVDIDIGKTSHGHTQGSVQYDKGFKFDYTASALDLKDIEVANLNLLGIAKDLKGSTQGDSHAATFTISTEAEDFYIKKYFLGDLSADVLYKSGVLKISDLDGILRATKYSGNLSVLFANTTIKGAIHSPYIELSDLQKAFALIAPLPFEFYGSGEADVTFSGPIELSDMSYVLKSRFINGNVANESFDEAVFNVTSQNGHVHSDKAFVKKSGGLLTMTGTAEPSAKINTQWVGKNFSLQTLSAFSKSDLSIDGQLDFDLALTEHILHPKSLLKGTLTHTRISQEKVDDSDFQLTFGKNDIEGSGNLFGKKITGKFLFPLNADAPFSVNAKIHEWDFVPLLHLVSSQSRAQEFSTLLTADIQLSSEKNGLWAANGNINVKDFTVERGIKQLQINNPFDVQFSQGRTEIKRFTLRGDNTSLEISGGKNPKFPMNIDLNGKIDLSLISFLTPFLDDLKGVLALTSQVSFSSKGWNLYGSGYVTQGFIRTDALPHSFDNIQADLLFNEDKILINKVSCDFAGGKINGNGSVAIKGKQDVRVDVQGKFDNVSLKVPKDVSSKGNGDFHITGNWFPYTMQGTYLIQSGLFAKQLDENDKDKDGVGRSRLLPESLTRKTTDPLAFDMDLIFSKGIDIRNDILESKAYGQLHMRGPAATPVFTGAIQLQRNGKIFFSDSTFEVETGDLKFNDPNKTNPDIYISANTTAEEVLDNPTRVQRYEINMLIQGKPDKLNINLSSTPPREQKDIISLLALGVSSENNTLSPTGSNQSQFSESSISKKSYGVGASILTKNKFGRDLQNKTGLQVKVSTAVDQMSNTTSPKITISKQWTPKIQTSASRTFGDLTTQDLKVEYQLNKNVSLVGSWVDTEISTSNAIQSTPTNITDKTSSDYLGLDLEYKFEFK